MTHATTLEADSTARRSPWRDRLFGRAREQHFQRRTSDWIRLVIGIVVLVIAARHAGDVTATEQALNDLVRTAPDQLHTVFLALYRLGALWAVGLVVVAALVARRVRLGRDLLVAGVTAWLLSRLLGEIVVAHETFGRGVRFATQFGASPAFPAVRVAVVTAVICAASPYVTRPIRIVGSALVGVEAFVALALARAHPNDLLGAVVLGWTVAAAVHLLFGSPGGRPTLLETRTALAQLGLPAGEVRVAERQPVGSTLMYADVDGRLLRVKVIGRDQTDARILAKLWRSVVYRDSGPPLTLTRLHQLEREAYLMLRAREQGARVPPVLAVGSAGHGSACLVIGTVGATPLAACSPDRLTDDLLGAIWNNVDALHRAGIAHGVLDAEHVVVSAEGPWIVGFDNARGTFDQERFAADVAELLTTTASLIGVDRAVRAATCALGPARAGAAVPFLQPAALTRTTRALTPRDGATASELLPRLREAASAAAGIDEPQLTQIRRLDPTNVAMTIGALVATAVLLNQVGDPGELWATIRNAEWTWITLAFALSFASNIGFAIGLMGTVPIRLPLWPTTEVQLGMSFSNLAVPAVGGQGMQIRYLQKMGVDLGSAIAAGGVLSTVGGLVAALGLFAVAVIVEPAHADFSLLPTTGLVELTAIVVAIVAVASGVFVAVPRLRRVAIPPIRRASSTLRSVLRSPRKVSLLIGGNVLALLLSTFCLAACTAAFGGHASFWALLAANIAVMTIASTVPIPGGSTAVGTVALSAVLVSFGVPDNVAVAATLTNQLVYYYLPAIPGWYATKHLLRHDYL